MSTQRTNSAQGTKKKRLTKKQRRKRKVIIFMIELLAVILLLAGLFIWQKLSKIDRGTLDKTDLGVNELDDTTKDLLSGYTNIVIFGLDNRSNGDFDTGNSDVIMIASINNDSKEVKIVSVYRDSYFNIGDDTYRKVNSAFAKGGEQQAVRALNANLDLNIEQYAIVDFQAVTDAIDLLGGVEIDVDDTELKWINSYIETTADVTGKESNFLDSAGTYTLDGTQATAYARLRYGGGEDYKRAERQREVVEQMIVKAKSASLTTLNDIIDQMCTEVKTSLTNKQLIGLVANIMDYDLTGSQGFPFELANETIGSKGDVVVPTDLATNVSELHEYLFGDTDYEPSNTVKAYSEAIIDETGLTSSDATIENNPLDTEESTEDSEVTTTTK